jgi:hypothetical protein
MFQDTEINLEPNRLNSQIHEDDNDLKKCKFNPQSFSQNKLYNFIWQVQKYKNSNRITANYCGPYNLSRIHGKGKVS